jgi:hypothetical protein
MSSQQILAVLLAVALWPVAGQSQYIAIGGGGVLSQTLTGTGPERAAFDRTGIFTLEGGAWFLPLIGAQIHYSYSNPEMFLQRADAFGSSARLSLGIHTITFDGRLHTPEIAGFRLYGLLGGGFSRINLTVKEQLETPFPSGAPSDLRAPVGAFGAGLEKSFAPFLRWKIEVRDDVHPIPKTFLPSGGAWHRTQIVSGIVIGP